MAGNKLIKMNVRSPFYINATSEEIIYEVPDTREKNVNCGDVVVVTEDVGKFVYKLETFDRTGQISIDYEIDVPIKFSITWNGTTTTTSYYGNSAYSNELLAAGASVSELTTLTTNAQATGTLNLVNKTSESPSVVELEVFAPIPTDNYKLTFNCPAQAAAPPAPSIVSRGNSEIFEAVPVLTIIEFDTYGFHYASLKINGTQVVTGKPVGRLRSNIIVTDYTISEAPQDTSSDRSNAFAFFRIETPPAQPQSTILSKSVLQEGENVFELTVSGPNAFSVIGGNTLYMIDTGVFEKESGDNRIAAATPTDARRYDYNYGQLLPDDSSFHLNNTQWYAVNSRQRPAGPDERTSVTLTMRWHTNGYWVRDEILLDSPFFYGNISARPVL